MREHRGRPVATARSAAVLVSALVALTSGCTSADGPRDGDGSARTALDPATAASVRARCVIADAEGELLLHVGALRVPARTELTGVALRDADNLDIVEAVTVPYQGSPGVTGVVLTYPPQPDAQLSDAMGAWSQRTPVAGSVLVARDGLRAVLLAVRLDDSGRPGHLTGAVVTQRAAAGDNEVALTQQLLVLPSGDRCTVDAVAATTEWTR